MTMTLPVHRNGRVVAHALIDAADADLAGRTWYSFRGAPYPTDGNRLSLHRAVARLKTGDGFVVHHINEDPLDNRRSNLRVFSSHEEHSAASHPRRDEIVRRANRGHRRRLRLRGRGTGDAA